MSLIGFKSQNHPQQRICADVDDRATTADNFAWFNTLGPFTIDVAAASHNTKCARYFSVHEDGLRQSWANQCVWCNPPYSNIGPWVQKAWEEYPRTRGIAMLLPANRTEQSWWHRWIEPHRDKAESPLRVTFLPGRMRFLAAGQTTIGPNERPPFGCCLITWGLASLQPQSDPTLFEEPA